MRKIKLKNVKVSEIVNVLKIYLKDNLVLVLPTLIVMFLVFAGYSFYCYSKASSDRLSERCTLETQATIQDRVAVGEKDKVSYYFLYLYKIKGKNYKVCSSIDISDVQTSFLVNEKVTLLVNPNDASECYEADFTTKLKQREQAIISKSLRNGVLFILLSLGCFFALYVRAALYVLKKIQEIAMKEMREQRQKAWESVNESDIIDVEFVD